MPIRSSLLPIFIVLGVAMVALLTVYTAKRGTASGIDTCYIIERALGAYPGKLLELTTEDHATSTIWKIRIQGRDNRLYQVSYDTQTGDMVNYSAQ